MLFSGWSLSSLLKELGLLKKKWRRVSQNHLKSEAKYNLFPKLSIYRVCSIEFQQQIRNSGLGLSQVTCVKGGLGEKTRCNSIENNLNACS